MTADPNPCQATGCDMEKDPVEACRKRGCGFRWQREAREDRARREEKDRRNGMVQGTDG